MVQLTTHNGVIAQNAVPDMQMFGFQSSPPPGTNFALVSMRGDRSNAFCVGSNHQLSRPRNMKSGESQLHDAFGQSVYLAGSSNVSLSANSEVSTNIGGNRICTLTKTAMYVTASANVTFVTPSLNVTGNISCGTGATGTFTSGTGETVTVQSGIIINIY